MEHEILFKDDKGWSLTDFYSDVNDAFEVAKRNIFNSAFELCAYIKVYQIIDKRKRLLCVARRNSFTIYY